MRTNTHTHKQTSTHILETTHAHTYTHTYLRLVFGDSISTSDEEGVVWMGEEVEEAGLLSANSKVY